MPLIRISDGNLAKYWEGGQAYCFGRMTSQISIVLEQKAIVFQNIGGHCSPSPPQRNCEDICQNLSRHLVSVKFI